MRLLILFVLFPFCVAAQKTQKSWAEIQLDAIYNSERFSYLPLVVSPDIYNPSNDTSIVHISFAQDSTNTVHDFQRVFAAISKKEGLDQSYVIGKIRNYMTDERHVTIIMNVTYSDGSEEKIYRCIHFDDVDFSFDYPVAVYSVKGTYRLPHPKYINSAAGM